MSAEARITPIWKKQKGLIALFFTGIGLWFLFDGMAGYPRSNERWLAHEKFKAEDRLSEWPAFAKKAGWNEEPPHKFYKKEDITGQYVLGVLSLLVGAGALVYWAGQIKGVFKLDGDTVVIPGGKRVPLESITGVNRKNWDAKGLATVFYTIDGRCGKYVLDDYKYDREPIHEIMAVIEAKLGRQEERPPAPDRGS